MKTFDKYSVPDDTVFYIPNFSNSPEGLEAHQHFKQLKADGCSNRQAIRLLWDLGFKESSIPNITVCFLQNDAMDTYMLLRSEGSDRREAIKQIWDSGYRFEACSIPSLAVSFLNDEV